MLEALSSELSDIEHKFVGTTVIEDEVGEPPFPNGIIPLALSRVSHHNRLVATARRQIQNILKL
jgi:hypothetical protein